MLILELSNCKKVGNFSSPHEFIFDDGTVLKAVSPEEATRLQVTFLETEKDNGDVLLSFKLSDDIWKEMCEWMNLWASKKVDVVFCPLPMITALKEANYDLVNSPFRSIRVEDRIKKLVSINKQCI